MQADIHGSYRVDGMQDVCNDPYPRLPAAPEIKRTAPNPYAALPAMPVPVLKPMMEASTDPCFGWRCPGCRSCHAPTLQTCPVCDQRKNRLVTAYVEATLLDDLAVALNPLEDPRSLFHTVHVKALLDAVIKLRT